MNGHEESPRCPVCQARFRGSTLCSRCGADLESLMLLAGKAYRLREVARQALHAGDCETARMLAQEAQATCSTEAGERLRLLSSWLLESQTRGPRSAGASPTIPSQSTVGNSKLETGNSELQAQNQQPETPNSKFQIPDSKAETWNSEVF